MVRRLLGWIVAKPLETRGECKEHTKELLARAARLDHLQETGPNLLNSRNVGRKDTKVTRHSRHVHLGHLNVVVERLALE